MSNKLKRYGTLRIGLREEAEQLATGDSLEAKLTSDSRLHRHYNTMSLIGNLTREGFERLKDEGTVIRDEWTEHPHRLSNKKGRIIQGKRYLKGR